MALGPRRAFVTCVPTRGWVVVSGTVPVSCVPHQPVCRQLTKVLVGEAQGLLPPCS